jgi:hypothetical protein
MEMNETKEAKLSGNHGRQLTDFCLPRRASANTNVDARPVRNAAPGGASLASLQKAATMKSRLATVACAFAYSITEYLQPYSHIIRQHQVQLQYRHTPSDEIREATTGWKP